MSHSTDASLTLWKPLTTSTKDTGILRVREKMSTFRKLWGHGSSGQKQGAEMVEHIEGMSMIQSQEIQKQI